MPRRNSRARSIVIGVFALVLLAVSVRYGAGSWMAHLGLGQRGTFTEVSLDCDSKSCIWQGSFTPDNNGPVRHGVSLDNGGTAPGPVGSQVPAVYVLGEAYPPGGGTWTTYSLVFVLEVTALVGVAIFQHRRRRLR